MKYNTWIYDCNGEKYVVIEALNDKGERIWIKFEPANKNKAVTVANILDRPNEVRWNIKGSHLELIDANGEKSNYAPVAVAGSMSVDMGISTFSKLPEANVYMFPVDHKKSINNFKVVNHLSPGSEFTIETDSPAWIGYVTTKGKIKKL